MSNNLAAPPPPQNAITTAPAPASTLAGLDPAWLLLQDQAASREFGRRLIGNHPAYLADRGRDEQAEAEGENVAQASQGSLADGSATGTGHVLAHEKKEVPPACRLARHRFAGGQWAGRGRYEWRAPMNTR